MGMAEIRDAFEAYSTGDLAEYELRSALRAEIQTTPDAVPRYAAMTAALRRRRLISAELEAAVISDMNAIVGSTSPPLLPSARTDSPARTDAPARAAANEPTGLRSPTTGPRNPTGPRSPTGPQRTTGAPHAADPRQPLDPQTGTLRRGTGTIFAPPPPPAAAQTGGRSTGTGNRVTGNDGKGVGWDAQEKLAEPEVALGIGMTLRERFELVDVLGRGGMGVVYKAIDQRDVENKGREPYVAIKVLNEEFKRHPESARALQRESKKSMRLAHPNIVLVRDFDRDRGNVFMVMELLHGTPLDQLVLRQFPKGMPLDRVIEIVNGLGAALSYAHQQGIVHADFKPSNAFLTEHNTVKVLDFGVARVALALDRNESTIFDAGKLNAVSPAYASIELLIGEAPDPRDDVYALACVTYFLLTGRHAYNGIDALKARESELRPQPIVGLPDPQWRALRGGLVFNRWDRTASVREFVAQFCSLQHLRAPNVVTQASKIAVGATVGLKAAVARGLDAAIRRPWLTAVPTALLLVAGAVILLAHRLPGAQTESAAAPVVSVASVPQPPPSATDVAASAPALQQRVAAINLEAPDFIDKAVASSSDIHSLAVLSPGDPTVQRLRAALQATLAVQVEGMLARNDIAGARRLVMKVGPLLPATSLRGYSSDALVRRQQLVKLMNAPVATQAWADQVSAAITDLATLTAADDPMIREARERSDAAFLAAAQQARSQQRTDQARELLAIGIAANPQSPTLTRAAVGLADATPASIGPQAATQHESSASAVPVAGAASGTPAGAASDANLANGALAHAPTSAGTHSGPVQAIMEQARQQMADADTEGALATLAAGRRKFGSAQGLKDLEITYDRVEEEFERIDMAPALNVKAHQEWLSEIQSLAGEDYPQIEQMLARTLSRDIEEQRARADRPTVVAALLSAGRKLFPDYAALLENPQVAAADNAAGPVMNPSQTKKPAD